MTKAVKFILIFAAVTVILGIIIVGVTLAYAGSSTDFFSGGNYTEQSTSYPADFSQIKTELSIADLTVTRTTGDEITLRYFENEYYTYSITTTSDILTITRQSRKRWLIFGFGFDWQKNVVEIGIPERFKGTLILHSSTGDIKITGLTVTGDFSAVSTTGSISVVNCSFRGDISTKASVGRVKLTSVDITGGLKAETTTGDVYVSSVNTANDIIVTSTVGDLTGSDIYCGGDIRISRSTGSVTIENVTAKTIRIEASAGDTDITNLTTSGSIYLESSTGDIRCSVTDGIASYNITSRTSTGYNNLPKSAGFGDKQLSVFTTTGDIRFTFAE